MQAGGREWWETRWAVALAILLAAAPLLWPVVPPLTDLPGHIGRYRVMLDGGTGPLAAWFDFRWRLTGNLGVDLLVRGLHPLLGLEPAVKFVTIAIPALAAAGILAISRAVHGRVGPYAIVALPLVWNQPLQMGFVNYALAMALMLLAFALWIGMAGSRRRAAVFVIVAPAIWLCHVFGWATLALAIFAAEVAASHRPVRAALACWPLAVPVPLMLATMGGGGGDLTGGYGFGAKLLTIAAALRDRWMAWDIVSVGIVLGFIGHGLWRGRIDRRAGAAALALLAALIALPAWLMGSAFADSRLAPYVLMIALIALCPRDRRQARAVALVAIAFVIARTGTTTISLAIATERQQQALAALPHIPVGARVVALVRPGCGDYWPVPRLDHVGGIVAARRRAFVNDQFQHYSGALLRVRHPAARPFERDPSNILACDAAALPRTVARIPRGAFDRLWLMNLATAPPARLPGMTRLWARGGDALYRIERTGN